MPLIQEKTYHCVHQTYDSTLPGKLTWCATWCDWLPPSPRPIANLLAASIWGSSSKRWRTSTSLKHSRYESLIAQRGYRTNFCSQTQSSFCLPSCVRISLMMLIRSGTLETILMLCCQIKCHLYDFFISLDCLGVLISLVVSLPCLFTSEMPPRFPTGQVLSQ